MESLNKIIKENLLHHTSVIIGSENTAEILKEFLEKSGVKINGNPDFVFLEYNTFGVDDAMEISAMSQRKSFDENLGKKYFVIKTNIITEPAQNTLLKLFEEPPKETYFFVVIPQDTIIDTLKSRAQIFYQKTSFKKSDILAMSFAERISFVKDLDDDIKDEKKIKQDAVSVVNDIENALYQNGVLENRKGLAECERAKKALLQNGAPVKMILENLMFSI